MTLLTIHGIIVVSDEKINEKKEVMNMEKATKLMELKAQKTVLMGMVEKLDKEWDLVTEDIYDAKRQMNDLMSMETYEEGKYELLEKRRYKLYGKRQGLNSAIFEIEVQISNINQAIIDMTRQIAQDENF